ncbi:hypothetical protein MRX96_009507 [Rhipicephalus microplus]
MRQLYATTVVPAEPWLPPGRGVAGRGGRACPPFAPQPHTGVQPGGMRSLSVTSAHAQQPQQQPVSTVTCNAHEVCHYFQQVFYVSAILTGIALVIAGAIQTGAPDASLSSELPPHRTWDRRAARRRDRRRRPTRPPSVPPATVHYNPLVSVGPPRQVPMPCAADIASGIHRQQPQMPSPGKAQRRGYGPASVHSVATVPAMPSAQPHWLLTPGSRAATVAASQPPPSYDNLLVVGHAPREVATLHLI